MSMRTNFKRSIVLGIFLVGTAGLFFWGVPLLFESSPVRMEKLTKVQIGMNAAQVREILGEPSNRFHQDKIWSYTGWGWSIVYVDFDDQGMVKGTRYDK
jgi:hypothetical protein